MIAENVESSPIEDTPRDSERRRNRAIIRALQKQTIDRKLQWREYPDAGYNAVAAALDTEAAGKIAVELVPQEESIVIDVGFDLFFTTGDNVRRCISAQSYEDLEMFNEMNALFDTVWSSIALSQETALQKIKEDEEALERGLDEVIDAEGIAL